MENAFVEKVKSGLKDVMIDFAYPRPNRAYIFIEPTNLRKSASFLFNELRCRFCIASAIDKRDGIEIIYHFHNDKEKIMVNLKTLVPKPELIIDTISDIIWGALWIEREIHELFGVKFFGHPNLEHLILADDWPEGVYPYRRELKEK